MLDKFLMSVFAGIEAVNKSLNAFFLWFTWNDRAVAAICVIAMFIFFAIGLKNLAIMIPLIYIMLKVTK